MPNVVIIDHHHKALLTWARVRRTLSHSPRLITLDHHTDTSKPFRNYIKQISELNSQLEPRHNSQIMTNELLSEVNFLNDQSVCLAIEKLNNDEHIVTALQTDIISDALVIAHNAQDTDIQTYLDHKIICRSVDGKNTYEKISRANSDRVLESSFLIAKLESMNTVLKAANQDPYDHFPFILDIDLDYFNTWNSINPKDSSFIKSLATKACAITIATEDEFVKNCALDHDLSSDNILKILLKLIQS